MGTRKETRQRCLKMSSRIDQDLIETVFILLSFCLGIVLPILFLLQNEVYTALVVFIVAIGSQFLLTAHGRDTLRRAAGMEGIKRQEEDSSTSISCSHCGWNNHRANNNCVECGKGLE